MEIIWIIIIISIAALIKGITGFGFALISLPLLTFWYSPKELIPVLILANLFSSIIIVIQKKDRKLINGQFRSLIYSGALFTLVGVITLKYISEDVLILIMSIFFIVLSTLTLIGVNYSFKLSDMSYKLAGAFCGFLTGCISVSGPPLALFLNSAHVDNQEFREIFSWFSIVTSVIALAGYYILGMLTFKMLELTILILPILFLGSYFGKRLNKLMPSKLFQKISILMTLVASIFLLVGLKAT